MPQASVLEFAGADKSCPGLRAYTHPGPDISGKNRE